MRNHPYFFNKQPAQITSIQAHPNTVVDPMVEMTYPGYIPRMVNLDNPRWFNNQDFVKDLGELTRRSSYKPDTQGYCIDGDGYIYQPSTDHDGNGGIIAAMAFVSEKENSSNLIVERTHLINTEDGGLRHIHVCNDGAVMDIGPVETACLVGNINRPEGIYVPLCNTRAMMDGVVLLDKMIELSIENDADLPPVTLLPADEKEIPATPFDDDHHECACGGKCNGKCGDKCKCGKHDHK